MTYFKKTIGRPSQYKHGRALTSTERQRAKRAKEMLLTSPIASPKYKKAFQVLENLYSQGINPNQKKTELKDRYGNRVDIHNFGWKDTAGYREEMKWDRYWGVRMANKKRAIFRGQPMSSAERVARFRLRKELEKELLKDNNKEIEEEEEEE